MTELDVRDFRRVCHAAARSTGRELDRFRPADSVTPDFHQCLLTHRGRTVAVVGARDAEVPAVAEPWDLAGGDAGPANLGEAFFGYWD